MGREEADLRSGLDYAFPLTQSSYQHQCKLALNLPLNCFKSWTFKLTLPVCFIISFFLDWTVLQPRHLWAAVALCQWKGTCIHCSSRKHNCSKLGVCNLYYLKSHFIWRCKKYLSPLSAGSALLISLNAPSFVCFTTRHLLCIGYLWLFVTTFALLCFPQQFCSLALIPSRMKMLYACSGTFFQHYLFCCLLNSHCRSGIQLSQQWWWTAKSVHAFLYCLFLGC